MRLVVILLSLGIAAGVSARGHAGGPAPRSDQDRLQGLWHWALLDERAFEKPENLPVLRISGNQVQYLQPGRKVEDTPVSYIFTLDPRQNPKTVDLQEGEGKGKVVYKGIYVIKDGEVKVAFAIQYRDKKYQPSSERPTSFDPDKQPKNAAIMVYVLKPAKGLPQPSKLEMLNALSKQLTAWEMAVNTDFRAVALSPDGAWLAASGAPSNAVRVWEMASGKELAILRGHAARVESTVFSRDGKRLFTADADKVRVWALPQGKLVRSITAPIDVLSYQLTLSRDDKWLVSGPDREPSPGPDGTLPVARFRLWNVETGREMRRFDIVRTPAERAWQYVDYFLKGRGADAVMGTAISRDGKWVVAGTQRGEVHVWDAATGRKLRTFGRSKDFVSVPLGFGGKNGQSLATQVYTFADGPKIWADPLHGPLATIVLWDAVKGKVRHVIRGNECGRGLSEDGQWLVTGREEKTVRIWDVDTGKKVRAFAGHQKPITACSLSRDKKLLATYDRSGTARLWDVVTGKELRTVEVHPQPDQIVFSQDAKTMVAWSRSRLTLWDLQKGKQIRSMRR
ncbi:MAG: TIGR03067 domain-containing protein [Gemmataceae bacterium]